MMDTNAATQTYPAGQHPPLLPPPSERGVIKWARERLFNTWYNALGTALMLVPVLFALLWIAGARTKHLAIVVLFGVVSIPLALAAREEGVMRWVAEAVALVIV